MNRLLLLSKEKAWDTIKRLRPEDPLRQQFKTRSQWFTYHAEKSTAERSVTRAQKAMYDPVVADFPLQHLQIDLFFLEKKFNVVKNRGVKILLTCIDVYSRFVWYAELKDKTAESVVAGMENILDQIKEEVGDIGARTKVTADDGSEWKSGLFRRLLTGRAIDLSLQTFTTDTVAENRHHVPVVERFHRDLRAMIFRAGGDDGVWVDTLQEYVDARNESWHSGVEGVPKELLHGAKYSLEHELKLKKRWLDKLPIGTKVRKMLQLDKFAKKTVKWSKEISTITGYAGVKYVLDDDPSVVWFRREILPV